MEIKEAMMEVYYSMYRFERWLAGDGTYEEIDKQTDEDISKFEQWIKNKTKQKEKI